MDKRREAAYSPASRVNRSERRTASKYSNLCVHVYDAGSVLSESESRNARKSENGEIKMKMAEDRLCMREKEEEDGGKILYS
jgi:hypothetical protein